MQLCYSETVKIMCIFDIEYAQTKIQTYLVYVVPSAYSWKRSFLAILRIFSLKITIKKWAKSVMFSPVFKQKSL